MDKDKLPEAPSSVTYSIMRNGFNMLFTVRDFSGLDLLDKMDRIEKELIVKGYKPQPARSYGVKKEPDYVEGRTCPTCGEKLVHAQMKDGKKFIKCSTNKWDPIAKKATGCPFVEWPKDPTDEWPQ